MTEEDRPGPRHGCLLATAALALVVGGIIVGALLYLGSNDDDDGGDSVAFQLAVLDGEVPVNEDDPTVDPYRDVLRRLGTRCTNDREQVADIAVQASAELVEDGVHERLLTILQSLEDAAPTGEPVDCASLSEPVVAELGTASP